jgi:hypothetical protein
MCGVLRLRRSGIGFAYATQRLRAGLTCAAPLALLEARFGKRALQIHSQVRKSRSLYQRPAAGRNQGRPL